MALSEDDHEHGRAGEKYQYVSPSPIRLVYFTQLCSSANRVLPKTSGFTFDGSFVVGGSDEGSGLEVTHTETGEKIHTFKTAGSCPVVAWAPTRYWLAYSDLGVLRIIGIDDKK